MTQFEELGLRPPLLKALEELGFTSPMPIQTEVIPIILEHRGDLIGLAQTGTGKTAAFGLPMIQRTDEQSRMVQFLILCPTRELCMQVAGDLTDFARYLKKIHILAVYGGASIEEQIRRLKKGPQIIVATPGRLLDLMNRNKVDISAIDSLVLDEADEMLNMGFQEELNAILAQTPDHKHTYLFSATMAPGVAELAGTHMKEALEVTIGQRNVGADNVIHKFYMVQAKYRYLALKRIVDHNPDIYGIVFCRTRIETKEVADKLIQDGYNADALHGDLSQAQRDHVMQRFRQKTLQILVATDVAARGLDVDDLTHVINYNLPDDLLVYTHRSGRTGRAGKRGVSIAIIHQKEQHKIKQIEKTIKKSFEYAPIPDGKSICEKQLFSLINKMEQVQVDNSQIDPYLDVIYKKLEWLSKEQLIKQFVALEFNRFLAYYKDAKDLNLRPGTGQMNKKEKTFKRQKMRDKSNMTRFFIKTGKKEKTTPPDLIGLMIDASGDRQVEIGKIDIFSSFSFVEVEKKYTEKILKNFERISNGIPIKKASPKNDTKRSSPARREKSGKMRRKKFKGRHIPDK
jgi:ATP-dependent RNA helicase DeaD